jgi:L-ascorbate metabolism protein UlaG (beta-lactamase superfamily)
VRATHAEHDGRRRVGPASERTSGPALGYLVCGPDSTTYFAGDTDMFAGMADLATGLATGIDLAVLPVGGWGLSLPIGHIDPVRAAEALPLLGATRAIPIHWGSLRIPGLWRLRPQLFIPPGPDFVAHAQLVAPQVDAFVATLGRPFEVTGPRSSFPRSSFPRA